MFVINEEYKIGDRIFSTPIMLLEDENLAYALVKTKNILAKERKQERNYSVKKLEVYSPLKATVYLLGEEKEYFKIGKDHLE